MSRLPATAGAAILAGTLVGDDAAAARAALPDALAGALRVPDGAR